MAKPRPRRKSDRPAAACAWSSYTQEDIDAKTEEVYVHVLRAYPRLPSPVYGMAA